MPNLKLLTARHIAKKNGENSIPENPISLSSDADGAVTEMDGWTGVGR